MAQATYVQDAERMIIRACLTAQGLQVCFADEREGLIPWEELRFGAEPRELRLPSPYVLEVVLSDGRVEELPWDYLRAWVDPEYRARAEAEARRGRRLLGKRLARLRKEAGLIQEALAQRSGVR